MRLLFAGTPDAAVPSLDALAAGPHEIVRVVTRPPAPQGRRRVLTPSPVEARALELGLPVLHASRLDDDATATLLADRADLGVVVAYGGLIREPLLSGPAEGWINLHFSLLPRWRGAAPVQHALIAGDSTTGVAVFRLEAGLDTGPLLAVEEVPIGALETAGHLLGRLAAIGAGVLAGAVDALAAGTATGRSAGGGADPRRQAHARGRPARPHRVRRRRARTATAAPRPSPAPSPRSPAAASRCWTPPQPVTPPRWHPGEVVLTGGRVLVGTADAPIELVTVQPAGRTPMPATAWLNGAARPVRLG